jgi:hypothetical protein
MLSLDQLEDLLPMPLVEVTTWWLEGPREGDDFVTLLHLLNRDLN